MYNCVYSGHCFEQTQCDNACPVLAQTSYLFERNGIQMNSEVFHSDPEVLRKYVNILTKSKEKYVSSVIEPNSTNYAADMLTYCSICENWRGSQLHCTVYNLKFSQYIDLIQKSWSNSGDSELDYIKIWINTAKVLVISSIDYVNFKDFQCQTLLSLIQSRSNPDFNTIIVSPPVSHLVGEGPFFARLTDLLSKQKVVCK